MELTEVFKQIVNNAPLEIIIFDKDCRIMYMNKTAQKTYSEILGSKVLITRKCLSITVTRKTSILTLL